jgi:NAD+ synthase (glutamine-hydrolysing)
MLASLAKKVQRPLFYSNLIGGNDELIFDGASLAFDSRGELLARGKMFEEDFVVVDSDASGVAAPPDLPDDEKCTKDWCWGSGTICTNAGSRRRCSG